LFFSKGTKLFGLFLYYFRWRLVKLPFQCGFLPLIRRPRPLCFFVFRQPGRGKLAEFRFLAFFGSDKMANRCVPGICLWAKSGHRLAAFAPGLAISFRNTPFQEKIVSFFSFLFLRKISFFQPLEKRGPEPDFCVWAYTPV